MTALDKKINQLAARHRWNVTPVHDRFIPCYSIVPMIGRSVTGSKPRLTAARA